MRAMKLRYLPFSQPRSQRRATCSCLEPEVHHMHRFLLVGGLVLSATLVGPLVLRADDDHHRERRYYDREHHDYHVWNDHEDRAYRVYLGERHQEYREWHRVNR